MTNSNKKMPLFTTFKRESIKLSTNILIRAIVIILSILLSLIICSLVVKDNIFNITKVLFEGAIALPWRLVLDTFILLGFGISIVPVFKMKYWNMGANGQVLMGCISAIVLMYKLGDWAASSSLNNILLIILMLVASILASVIWAVIPAIFKVFFKTNETLFTLMMNYIAATFVTYINYVLANGKKESPGIINPITHAGWFPTLINKYFLPAFIILVITVFIYFYVNKTKHGYEVTVLGDSFNTAKYVGMDTTKIMIRTLILSGIITGIIGFLYASAINHSINAQTGGSLGFTGVLVAWLSNFNPIIMAAVSFLLSFLTLGTSNVSSSYRLGSDNLSSIMIGLIFFAILISEFFIRYRLKINIQRKKGAK